MWSCNLGITITFSSFTEFIGYFKVSHLFSWPDVNELFVSCVLTFVKFIDGGRRLRTRGIDDWHVGRIFSQQRHHILVLNKHITKLSLYLFTALNILNSTYLSIRRKYVFIKWKWHIIIVQKKMLHNCMFRIWEHWCFWIIHHKISWQTMTLDSAISICTFNFARGKEGLYLECLW